MFMVKMTPDGKKEFIEELFMKAIKDVAQKSINRKIKKEKFNFTVAIMELEVALRSTNGKPVDLTEFLPDLP